MPDITMDDQNTTTTGPLKFPAPPNAATSRALNEALKGHTTSEAWLPAGVFPELDGVRDEHLRLRGDVAADLAALDDLTAQHRQEDTDHQEALRASYRAAPPRRRIAARRRNSARPLAPRSRSGCGRASRSGPSTSRQSSRPRASTRH